jgi:hypothetical protein
VIRLFAAICLISCIPTLIPPVVAVSYEVILKGKVVMRDGSPLPPGIGIQRHCDNGVGSAPGPLANNKTGEYMWHMDADSMATRSHGDGVRIHEDRHFQPGRVHEKSLRTAAAGARQERGRSARDIERE